MLLPESFQGDCDWGVFLFVVSMLACVFLPLGFGGLWLLVSVKAFFNYSEKKTSFECGFDALSNSWAPFSLRFYVLALLFMVVDVEIVLFFCLVFSKGVFVIFFSFFMEFWLSVFLGLLAGALLHEDNEGSQEWKG
uniref:NADH dehydrogenase subunit 3 n=1 Tax=Xyloredo nooi TaxID=2584333 RepID=UPI002028D628|nr:NADH dehydrogenase subunit 3 [Xyloredo nooi]UPX88988.1 NADH dehydrogenase subunit 3 [Xyloredo nooi]UPX89000.1 NADH dehydrogenase subunit 3 [Xyloredo nooi]